MTSTSDNAMTTSERVASELREQIERKSIAPGARLPAERELASRFGVSRSTVREAIRQLNCAGLVFTRRGGGTFVSEEPPPESDCTLATLLGSGPRHWFDIIEVRQGLEGTAAYFAALRATDADRQLIRQRYDRLCEVRGGADPIIESRADAEFHLAIVQAAHNTVLEGIMNGLFDLLLNNVRYNLRHLYKQPEIADPLNRQHENILKAVLNSDPERARAAAQDHMIFVEQTLHRVGPHEAPVS